MLDIHIERGIGAVEIHIVKEIWRNPNICFMDRLSFPKQEYKMKVTEKDSTMEELLQILETH